MNPAWNFRQGNRTEYLALYILSALGMSQLVDHREDIGTDFFCALGTIEETRIKYHSPYVVQLKSFSYKNRIFFGGPDKRDQIHWLFTQKLPLFIGIGDKDNHQIELYSTSNMWQIRYKVGDPGQVHLRPDVPATSQEEIPQPTSKVIPDWPANLIGDNRLYEIPLGPPLVRISVKDIEDEANIRTYQDVLGWAVRFEQLNLIYRDLDTHYSKWPSRINTNSHPTEYRVGCCYNSARGRNTDEQLAALAPILTALALNFKHQECHAELQAVKSLVKLLPKGARDEFHKLVAGMND